MDIYLDDQLLETDAKDINGIIDAAHEKLTDGRIIVEIRLDGDTVTDDGIDQIDTTLTQSDIQELQLITSDPLKLSITGLNDLKDALAAIRDDQKQAAELLAEEKTAEAFDHIQQALNYWLTVQQTVLKISQLLNLSLDEMTVLNRPIPEAVQGITEKLNSIKGYLENQDWVGLTDMMGYELDEEVDYWLALVDQLLEKLNTLGSGE